MKTLLTTFGLILSVAMLSLAGAPLAAHAEGESGARGARATTTTALAASTARLSRRGEHLALRVATRLDVARRERDRLRATCLDDTLSQVHAALRVIEHESERPASSARARVLDRVWTARLGELDRQAMACERNDDVDTSGRTRVITTIDPSTPNIDPTVLPRDRHRDAYRDPR